MSNKQTTFFIKAYIGQQLIVDSKPVETTMESLGHKIATFGISAQIEFDERKDHLFRLLSKDAIENARPSLTVELWLNGEVFIFCTKKKIQLRNLDIEISLICETIQAGVEDFHFNWDKQDFDIINSGKTLNTDRYNVRGQEIPKGYDFRSLDGRWKN